MRMPPATHEATVALPATVATYFNILHAQGAEVAYTPGDRHAKVRLEANDLYELATTVRTMETEIGKATGATTRVARPSESDGGYYLALVPVIDDAVSFFDSITGLAAVKFDHAEPHATVIFFEDDEYALAATVSELNTELEATIGYNTATIDRPTRLA